MYGSDTFDILTGLSLEIESRKYRGVGNAKLRQKLAKSKKCKGYLLPHL